MPFRVSDATDGCARLRLRRSASSVARVRSVMPPTRGDRPTAAVRRTIPISRRTIVRCGPGVRRTAPRVVPLTGSADAAMQTNPLTVRRAVPATGNRARSVTAIVRLRATAAAVMATDPPTGRSATAAHPRNSAASLRAANLGRDSDAATSLRATIRATIPANRSARCA